jgi:para-nitrobenzyl esterase
MAFEPHLDGDVLPDLPQRRITDGAGAGVRLLIGTNRDEMTLFMVPTGLLELTGEAVLLAGAGAYGLPAQGVAAYRATRPEASVGELIVDTVSDWFFRVPAIRIAEARTRRGEAPTYMYEFGWRTTAWEGKLRATHALEIAFVFDNLAEGDSSVLLGDSAPQPLAREMHAAWVDFVTTGDPGWPVYGEQRRVQTFAETTELVEDPRSEARQAWDGLR